MSTGARPMSQDFLYGAPEALAEIETWAPAAPEPPVSTAPQVGVRFAYVAGLSGGAAVVALLALAMLGWWLHGAMYGEPSLEPAFLECPVAMERRIGRL